MENEKKSIAYKVQKGNRPKIEDVIACCLDGELRAVAMDFAVWMRENKMPFKLYTSSTRSQRAAYKNTPICNIIVCIDGDNFLSGELKYWSLALNLVHMEKYEPIIRDEGLRIEFNSKISFCGHSRHGNGKTACDPDKICVGGRDMTVFGDGYDGICKWLWPFTENPDEAAVKIIKRLLELERQARDELNK